MSDFNHAKKTVSFLLAIIMIVISVPYIAWGTASYSVGDINVDGKINAVDSNLLKRVVLGTLTERKAFLMSDINTDDKVNAVDTNYIRRIITGAYVLNTEPYKICEITLGGVDICEYSIRIPAEYPFGTYKESAKYAAEILQSRIKEACGITLPISDIPTKNDIALVYDIDTYGQEAFNISVNDGNVVLTCGSKRGPLYAAFGFLEEILGYRFYGQNSEYLNAKDSVIADAGYNHTEGLNTPFKYRHTYTRLYLNHKYYGAYDGAFPDSYSAAHITGNWDGMANTMNTPKYGYGYGPDRNHSMFALTPNACENDKYVIEGRYSVNEAMVCYTSKDSFNECLGNLRIYLKSLEAKGFVDGDNMPMISISNNDNFYWCSCRNCNKLMDKYNSPSATIVDFIKRISDALEPEYPNLQFWTLGYYCTSIAPQGMEIPDNLYLCYCYYPACNNHSVDGSECDNNSGGTHNKWNEDNIIKWASVTDNIHVWYYISQFSFAAAGDPIMRQVYNDFKYFRDLGVSGIFAQNSNDSLGWDDLIAYLTSEMMWNPDMSLEEYEALAKEFCSFKYGPGGDKLYEYFELMDEASDRAGCWCCLADSPNYMYDYDFLCEKFDYVTDLLKDALSMTETDEQHENVERIIMQMYFMYLTASYDNLYANGSSVDRSKYAECYTEMYNLFVKYKNTVRFSDMPITTDGKIPETCDTTVSPISWYSKPDVRINGLWWW